MSRNGWPPVILFFSIALLGSVLNGSAAAQAWAWTGVLPSLYFLPIVIAAINLGVKAAAGVAVASGVAYALESAIASNPPWTLPLAETVLFVCVGITAASLTKAHGGLGSVRPLVPGGRTDESPGVRLEEARSVRSVAALRALSAGLIRRFRTPVASIEGAVWLLEDADLPNETRAEILQILRKETSQLDRAMGDVLEFTQPLRLKLSTAGVSDVVDRAIQLTGPGGHSGDHPPSVIFRKELGPDLPPLRCDPDLIAKMLRNLAINAVQASPNGGQVRLTAGIETANLVISIQDPGRGITPGTEQVIFDPFFSTRENALGLGLTVARQIATAHGGTIELYNLAGTGAAARVVLPVDGPTGHEHGSHTSS